ncbi:MAG: TonB-dependent receptor [Bacteroidetes bacterium]|nr:TonB-dependent receptor [Bacteroidota bacterium]
MKKIVIIAICFFMSVAISTVYGQDTIPGKAVDQLFELTLSDFLNVVITPSKLPQTVNNITQKVDVIGREEIESTIYGNRNVCEAIAKLPGASVSVLSRNDANWGTYGGIGPKYSTYMLQGLPIDAFMDPMSLDLNAIDHIEVQRGPASVIYPNYLSQDFAGSQCPLAGTVNLILKDKVEKKQTTLQTAYGSYNTLNGQIFHQNRVDRLNYFVGSTYEISDYTKYGVAGSWLNMKNDPEYQKTKIYGGLTLFLDDCEKQKLTVFCQKSWHEGNTGRTYKGYAHQYSTVNVGYNIEFNDRFSMQSHIGIRTYDRTWQESRSGVIDTLTSNNGVNQLIIPADLSFLWLHGKSGGLSIGADYQGARYFTWMDPLLGYQIFGNKSSAVQGGLYLQEEWRPASKLIVRGGLRMAFIQNTIDLVYGNNPADNKVLWNKLLWSAGLKYTLSRKVAVYANSGSSFSTPGLKATGGTISTADLGIPGHNGQLPNPGLKPENGIGIDVGVECKFPASFKMSVRGFYTVVQDGIVDNVVCRNPSQTQSINTESTAGGGEIELTQKIFSNLSWYINATYIISNIKNDLNPDQNNVNIPFSPTYIINVGASLHTSFGLEFSPSLNYNDGYYDGISRRDHQWYTPGMILNTYLSQLVATSDIFTMDCFAQVYNITDNNCNLPWQFKNPGFSCMLGIKMTF